MTTTHRFRRSLLLPLIPLAVAVGACGTSAGADPTAPAAAPIVAGPATPASPAEGSTTLVARPGVDTPVFGDPGAPSPAQVLPAHDEFGSALALVVVDDSVTGWLHVQLPTRPNESTGWIRSEGVELREVALSIHVDLATHRLVLRDGGEVVLETPVAIGAPGTPTPRGTFFVVDKLATGDEGGPYGPFALGLSAHSEVLTQFAGGDGQVGIHGTNAASSIGESVSNGCVRVPNDVIVRLNELLPLGTPVVIS